MDFNLLNYFCIFVGQVVTQISLSPFLCVVSKQLYLWMQRPKRKGSNQLKNKEKILCSHLTAQQWAQEAKKLEALVALQWAQEVKEDLVYDCTWLTFESDVMDVSMWPCCNIGLVVCIYELDCKIYMRTWCKFQLFMGTYCTDWTLFISEPIVMIEPITMYELFVLEFTICIVMLEYICFFINCLNLDLLDY